MTAAIEHFEPDAETKAAGKAFIALVGKAEAAARPPDATPRQIGQAVLSAAVQHLAEQSFNDGKLELDEIIVAVGAAIGAMIGRATIGGEMDPDLTFLAGAAALTSGYSQGHEMIMADHEAQTAVKQ